MKKREVKDYARKILDPIVSVLTSLGVPPMLVSFLGLLLSLYGAVVVARGQLALGGVFLLLSGICDVLDGDLARRRSMASRFGAFLDSTLDRVAEFGFFGVIVFTWVQTPRFCGAPLAWRVLRWRKELNVHCSAGAVLFLDLALRPLRTSWLIVGTLYSLLTHQYIALRSYYLTLCFAV